LNYVIETHTHTIASGHVHSTIKKNFREFNKIIEMMRPLNVPQSLNLNININRMINHLITKGKLNDLR